jgi:CheY-like chemotaxis protein
MKLFNNISLIYNYYLLSLSIALMSSHHLMLMINDILDMSQIDSGNLRLNLTQFSVSECVKHVSKLIRFQVKRKGLSFSVENLSSHRDKVLSVTSDAVRLKQILFNLIGNALKFTTKGRIRILYGRAQDLNLWEDLGEKTVVFKVEDSGAGIKEANLPKLFKLFGKLEEEKESKVNQTGIGLGLSISQNLVKRLNKFQPEAEIQVKTKYKEGSCFYFPLISHDKTCDSSVFILDTDERGPEDTPRIIRNLSRMDESECNTITESWFQSKRRRILIVDDDQINILVATQYIKNFGNYDHSVAFNGLEALELVKAKAKEGFFYDLVLMDCNMPIMDGYQSTRMIMTMVREKQIPPLGIIAATANASPQDREDCFKAGMIDFLTKPFHSSELKNTLDAALMRIKKRFKCL